MTTFLIKISDFDLTQKKTQVDVVNSIISNFSTALAANETALNSSGSAMRENAAYMEGLQAKLNALKSEFNDFAINIISSQFIKSMFEAGTAILKFANSDIGQSIIQISLLTGATFGLIALFGKLKTAFLALEVVSVFGTYLRAVTIQTFSLTGAMNVLTSAIKLNPLFFGVTAIIAGLYAFKKANDAVTQSLEDSVGVQTTVYKDLKKEIDASNDTLKESISSATTAEQQAKNYAQTIEDLANKTNKSNLEQLQFQNAVKGLNELYPELALQIDATTGKLNMETQQVWKAVEGYTALAKAKAYSNLITETQESVAKAELRAEALQSQMKTALGKKEDAFFKGYWDGVVRGIEREAESVDKSINKLKTEQAKYEENLSKYLNLSTPVSKPTAPKLPTGGGMSTVKTSNKSSDSNKKEEDALKKLHEINQKIISDMELQLWYAEQRGDSEEAQIVIIRQVQDEVHKQAEYYRSIGLAANHEYLQSLGKQWWEYENKITKMEADRVKEQEELQKKQVEAQKDRLNESINQLNAQLKAMEWYAEEQQKIIQDKIDGLNKEKEALEDANAERENAIRLEELEENLARAKAKRVKVYKEGQGFVYEQDISAISQAQEALEEFRAEQIHQAKLDRIDEAIEGYEEEKQEWADFVSDYKTEQDKLLNEITLGMTTEKFLMDNKITNLESFKDEYIDIIDDLVRAQERLSNLETSGGGGDIYEEEDDSGWDGLPDIWYKDGTTSVPFNQYAGYDEAGEELIIPPSTNMGKAGVMAKGTGIVPHTLTENLMDIGRYSMSQLKTAFGTSKIQTSQTINQFDKIVLPNVTDGQSFIKELSNFRNLAIQSAYART